ncbi:MAG: amino acid ABC transporter permease [Proteobacteria bacterium]|nr:amino acid ABC transporter permease [Pseudomonadota bacterium]MDA1131799.1 amino acid ABC transporter permease [Pseudomonadota bacterium]
MTGKPRHGPSLGRLWTDERVRGAIFQFLTVLGLIAFVWFLVANTSDNMAQIGMKAGFGFLGDQAFFDINQKLIDYTSTDTYGRALMVGLLNTLLVSVLGIVAATLLGFLMGVLRLSHNWLVARLATVYVETIRNIPLLLQVVFWWTLLTELPRVQESKSIAGLVFLNNRGVRMPAPVMEPGMGIVVVAFLAGIVAAFFVTRWATRRRMETGQPFPSIWVNLGLVVGAPVALFLLLGQPLHWDVPVLGTFNFSGGFRVTPELVALWWALTVYTGAFIAETVRGGILAVSKGQTEAAQALGLSRGATMRKIVLPQALRVIVPPLTSQYLNLTKNSSLAVAIGYQDLVSVGGTILNQSGHSIEIVGIWLAVYLSLSVGTSAFMNWYNHRVRLVER